MNISYNIYTTVGVFRLHEEACYADLQKIAKEIAEGSNHKNLQNLMSTNDIDLCGKKVWPNSRYMYKEYPDNSVLCNNIEDFEERIKSVQPVKIKWVEVLAEEDTKQEHIDSVYKVLKNFPATRKLVRSSIKIDGVRCNIRQRSLFVKFDGAPQAIVYMILYTLRLLYEHYRQISTRLALDSLQGLSVEEGMLYILLIQGGYTTQRQRFNGKYSLLPDSTYGDYYGHCLYWLFPNVASLPVSVVKAILDGHFKPFFDAYKGPMTKFPSSKGYTGETDILNFWQRPSGGAAIALDRDIVINDTNRLFLTIYRGLYNDT